MAGVDPKCYMCGKYLPHSADVKGPNLCACEARNPNSTREPELHIIDGSEICGCVDPHGVDMDNICRPINVTQEENFIDLTIPDAKRLLEFLTEAIPYAEARMLEH